MAVTAGRPQQSLSFQIDAGVGQFLSGQYNDVVALLDGDIGTRNRFRATFGNVRVESESLIAAEQFAAQR